MLLTTHANGLQYHTGVKVVLLPLYVLILFIPLCVSRGYQDLSDFTSSDHLGSDGIGDFTRRARRDPPEDDPQMTPFLGAIYTQYPLA